MAMGNGSLMENSPIELETFDRCVSLPEGSFDFGNDPELGRIFCGKIFSLKKVTECPKNSLVVGSIACRLYWLVSLCFIVRMHRIYSGNT